MLDIIFLGLLLFKKNVEKKKEIRRVTQKVNMRMDQLG